jgi:predicted small lipoprotein YifL
MRIVITTLALTLVLGVFASLYGCGLKGPLYLPEPAKAVEPVPAANQATDQPADQSPDQNDADEEAGKKKIPAQPAPDTTR